MPALHVKLPRYRHRPAARVATLPILIFERLHACRCNCRCVMCDIWKREANDQIRVQDLERHSTSLENLGVRHVVLTGGEPCVLHKLQSLRPCTISFLNRQIFTLPF